MDGPYGSHGRYGRCFYCYRPNGMDGPYGSHGGHGRCRPYRRYGRDGSHGRYGSINYWPDRRHGRYWRDWSRFFCCWTNRPNGSGWRVRSYRAFCYGSYGMDGTNRTNWMDGSFSYRPNWSYGRDGTAGQRGNGVWQ